MQKLNREIYSKLKEILRKSDEEKIHFYAKNIDDSLYSEYVIIFDNIKLVNIYRNGKVVKSYFIVGFNNSHKNALNKYDINKIFVIDKGSKRYVNIVGNLIYNDRRFDKKIFNYVLRPKNK